MREERFVISDRCWVVIEPLVPGTKRDPGVTAKDTRLFLETALWRERVGGPWRDLPPGFAGWNRIFQRFRAGRKVVYSNAFSRPYQMIPILSTFSLMERLSALTKRQTA